MKKVILFVFSVFLLSSFANVSFAGGSMMGTGVLKHEACTENNLLVLSDSQPNTINWPYRVAEPAYCIHIYPISFDYWDDSFAGHKFYYTLPEAERMETGYYSDEDYLGVLDGIPDGALIEFQFSITGGVNGEYLITDVLQDDIVLNILQQNYSDETLDDANDEVIGIGFNNGYEQTWDISADSYDVLVDDIYKVGEEMLADVVVNGDEISFIANAVPNEIVENGVVTGYISAQCMLYSDSNDSDSFVVFKISKSGENEMAHERICMQYENTKDLWETNEGKYELELHNISMNGDALEADVMVNGNDITLTANGVPHEIYPTQGYEGFANGVPSISAHFLSDLPGSSSESYMVFKIEEKDGNQDYEDVDFLDLIDDADLIPIPPAGFEDEVITAFDFFDNPFPDTDMTKLDGQAAAELYRRGVIGGFPDGEFKGDRDVNRAEAAKFLLLGRYGEVDEVSNNGKFSDVLDGEWYTKFVVTAAMKGVISGYADGTFRPANNVNTAEFLKMLTLTFDLELNMPYSYSDVGDNDWYAQYVGVAKYYNLFPNRSINLYPASELTRNEVAVAIYQYLKNR